LEIKIGHAEVNQNIDHNELMINALDNVLYLVTVVADANL